MQKTPLIKKSQEALLGCILLFLLTVKSAATPLLIEKFSSTGKNNLEDTLRSIQQAIKEQHRESMIIEFKDPELRKVIIPNFEVRRVFLTDLLTALSKLSHTEIEFQKTTITVSPTTGVVSENPPSNPHSNLDGPKKNFIPLDTSQAIVQLYDLNSYLRAEETLGPEEILDRLQESMAQTSKFRGDTKPEFELRYIATAEAVYLKAPIQYHLNLTNQLATLPAKQPEVKYEVALAPAPEPTSPEEPKAAPKKSDMAILISAIQELSTQVESLKAQVAQQQETIEKLSESLPSGPE